MNKNAQILKYSLLAGAVYFAALSLAHVLGIKIPGLFIYYNIPSQQYQDNIISFLAFGWAAFFYTASQNLNVVKPILVSGVVALLGVANTNLSTDFGQIVGSPVSTTPFWIQFGLLAFYASWLIFFTVKMEAQK